MKDKSIIYYTETNTKTEIVFDSINEFIQKQKKASNSIVIIADERLRNILKIPDVIWMASGETLKTFSGLEMVLDILSKNQLDRSSMVIAIGGGAISDTIGLACSLYHRGIPMTIIPTTLLSIVDASIGGKNALNFHEYKNQIGSIYQPNYIVIDVSILDSLPMEEFSQGMAEIVKYGVSLDAELFDLVRKNSLKELYENRNLRNEIIKTSIQIKCDIVSQDVEDRGIRRILNFGHTVGHAIEVLKKIPHGSAVSLGMIAALRFSETKMGLDAKETDDVIDVLNAMNLPTKLDINPQELYEAMQRDKKRQGHEVAYVFINKIGDAVIEPILLEEWKDFFKKNPTIWT